MGNSISLEENEYEHQSNTSSDIEMKSGYFDESGENSNSDTQTVSTTSTTIKKTKKSPVDVLKKRRSTSKNTSSTSYKKTKSNKRR